MKQTAFNANLEKFVRWSKICIVTAITAFLFFGVGTCLLTVLKAFTDFEAKAPFLYGKIFAGILLAVFSVVFAFEIFGCVKARKYKKQIEETEREGNDEETNDR